MTNEMLYEVYNVRTGNIVSKPADLSMANIIRSSFQANNFGKSYAVRPVFDYDAFIADVTAQDLEDRMVDAVAVEQDRQWAWDLRRAVYAYAVIAPFVMGIIAAVVR